jgi:hypothetical protein
METVQTLLRYSYSKYVFLLLIALIQYLLPLKAKAGNIMFFGPTLDELWSVTFFLALIGLTLVGFVLFKIAEEASIPCVSTQLTQTHS